MFSIPSTPPDSQSSSFQISIPSTPTSDSPEIPRPFDSPRVSSPLALSNISVSGDIPEGILIDSEQTLNFTQSLPEHTSTFAIPQVIDTQGNSLDGNGTISTLFSARSKRSRSPSIEYFPSLFSQVLDSQENSHEIDPILTINDNNGDYLNIGIVENSFSSPPVLDVEPEEDTPAEMTNKENILGDPLNVFDSQLSKSDTIVQRSKKLRKPNWMMNQPFESSNLSSSGETPFDISSDIAKLLGVSSIKNTTQFRHPGFTPVKFPSSVKKTANPKHISKVITKPSGVSTSLDIPVSNPNNKFISRGFAPAKTPTRVSFSTPVRNTTLPGNSPQLQSHIHKPAINSGFSPVRKPNIGPSITPPTKNIASDIAKMLGLSSTNNSKTQTGFSPVRKPNISKITQRGFSPVRKPNIGPSITSPKNIASDIAKMLGISSTKNPKTPTGFSPVRTPNIGKTTQTGFSPVRKPNIGPSITSPTKNIASDIAKMLGLSSLSNPSSSSKSSSSSYTTTGFTPIKPQQSFISPRKHTHTQIHRGIQTPTKTQIKPKFSTPYKNTNKSHTIQKHKKVSPLTEIKHETFFTEKLVDFANTNFYPFSAATSNESPSPSPIQSKKLSPSKQQFTPNTMDLASLGVKQTAFRISQDFSNSNAFDYSNISFTFDPYIAKFDLFSDITEFILDKNKNQNPQLLSTKLDWFQGLELFQEIFFKHFTVNPKIFPCDPKLWLLHATYLVVISSSEFIISENLSLVHQTRTLDYTPVFSPYPKKSLPSKKHPEFFTTLALIASFIKYELYGGNFSFLRNVYEGDSSLMCVFRLMVLPQQHPLFNPTGDSSIILLTDGCYIISAVPDIFLFKHKNEILTSPGTVLELWSPRWKSEFSPLYPLDPLSHISFSSSHSNTIRDSISFPTLLLDFNSTRFVSDPNSNLLHNFSTLGFHSLSPFQVPLSSIQFFVRLSGTMDNQATGSTKQSKSDSVEKIRTFESSGIHGGIVPTTTGIIQAAYPLCFLERIETGDTHRYIWRPEKQHSIRLGHYRQLLEKSFSDHVSKIKIQDYDTLSNIAQEVKTEHQLNISSSISFIITPLTNPNLKDPPDDFPVHVTLWNPSSQILSRLCVGNTVELVSFLPSSRIDPLATPSILDPQSPLQKQRNNLDDEISSLPIFILENHFLSSTRYSNVKIVDTLCKETPTNPTFIPLEDIPRLLFSSVFNFCGTLVGISPNIETTFSRFPQSNNIVTHSAVYFLIDNHPPKFDHSSIDVEEYTNSIPILGIRISIKTLQGEKPLFPLFHKFSLNIGNKKQTFSGEEVAFTNLRINQPNLHFDSNQILNISGDLCTLTVTKVEESSKEKSSDQDQELRIFRALQTRICNFFQ